MRVCAYKMDDCIMRWAPAECASVLTCTCVYFYMQLDASC